MRVKCLSRYGHILPDSYLDQLEGFNRGAEFYVTEGVEYVVYGIVFRQEQVWYYICDDCYTDYPRIHPSPLFEITDDKLSSYWRLSLTPDDSFHFCLLSCPEWIQDPYFYDRLTDGFAKEVYTFRKMKKLIDEECGIPPTQDDE